jgi:OOP family OmpA-OmpF porin
MKKLIFTFLILSGMISFAQKRSFNQLSIEANYGLSLPTTPIPDGRKAGEFNGFTHFSFGARYMFIPEIGAKLSYAHDKFQDSNTTSNNLVYHRFDLEAVSNLVALFNLQSDFWDDFGLLAHAGVGYISANPTETDNNERLGNLLFGINPMYRLSEKFALSLDFAYNINPKMNFGYDGNLIEPDYDAEFKDFNGGFLNITFGVKYYIGNRGEHADWQ